MKLYGSHFVRGTGCVILAEVSTTLGGEGVCAPPEPFGPILI